MKGVGRFTVLVDLGRMFGMMIHMVTRNLEFLGPAANLGARAERASLGPRQFYSTTLRRTAFSLGVVVRFNVLIFPYPDGWYQTVLFLC